MGNNETDAKLQKVIIEDNFWSYYQNLVLNQVLPYQEKILRDEIPEVEKSRAIKNFEIAAGEISGEFYGMVFQDSDLAKWLEAVGNALAIKENKQLQQRAERVISLIEKSQSDDGYINTYFQICEPEKKWKNLLECHELYCAGHMIEAAVAYYESTGERRFLDIMCRFADHIDKRFGKNKLRGIPGHEEIELALLRLYRVTGEKRYRNLAEYFLNERGTEPNYFAEEKKKRNWDHWPMNPEDRKYSQNHKPIREQDTAEGHSVRAVYLYTAMADMASELNDKDLISACKKIWRNIVDCRMYITGGIGSTVDGESFTIDYDLPNDTAYAETCASIGLVFFARKMLHIEINGEYADIIERELYNGILSGMQHDGTRFFYVNPLEVVPEISGKLYGYQHVLPQRPQWYACACCPPNVSRLITSLGRYAWGEKNNVCYSHLYIGGTYETSQCSGLVLHVISEYPWKGTIKYIVTHGTQDHNVTLAIRIPGWCENFEILLNGKPHKCISENGYIYIKRCWAPGDTLNLDLDLIVQKVYANTKVRKDCGCVAVMRGPVVYCLEEIDNGNELHNLVLGKDNFWTIQEKTTSETGKYIELITDGFREKSSKELYNFNPPVKSSQKLHFLPYYLWGNRGLGEMRVWIREER